MGAGHPQHDVAAEDEEAVGGSSLDWRQKCDTSSWHHQEAGPSLARPDQHTVNVTQVKSPQDSCDLADGVDSGGATIAPER